MPPTFFKYLPWFAIFTPKAHQLYNTLDTTIFVFIHFGFSHSFSKYSAGNETEQNIASVFKVSVSVYLTHLRPRIK
jgi:hypothetical protein